MARRKKCTLETAYKKVTSLKSQEQQNELARDIFNYKQGWGAREALAQQEKAAEKRAV